LKFFIFRNYIDFFLFYFIFECYSLNKIKMMINFEVSQKGKEILYYWYFNKEIFFFYISKIHIKSII